MPVLWHARRQPRLSWPSSDAESDLGPVGFKALVPCGDSSRRYMGGSHSRSCATRSSDGCARFSSSCRDELRTYFFRKIPPYAALFGAQIAFYGLSLVGNFLPTAPRILRYLRLPTMFTAMNVALLFGFFKWLCGRCQGAWIRTARHPTDPNGGRHGPNEEPTIQFDTLLHHTREPVGDSL